MHLGLLTPLASHRSPRRPSASAFGKAARAAGHVGIDLVLTDHVEGGRAWGSRVEGDAWVPAVGVRCDAWLHRFPDGDRPADWTALVRELGDAPLVNPEKAVALCRDKAACHDLLAAAGVPVPDQVAADLPRALDAWGAAFLKPRHGAFGRGVRRVVPGDALPEGDDWVLQRAVPPPQGWAGVSVRVLVQREPDGSWHVAPGAVRRHATDPVVNHARGATVVPTDVLDRPAAVDAAALAAATALAAQPWGDDLGELGVDVVVDPDGGAWVIEVNGKPRGRLEALAALDPARFGPEHEAALLRPLRFAASRVGTPRPATSRGGAPARPRG